MFLELFAGTANLTREVNICDIPVEQPQDIASGDRSTLQSQYDILDPRHFRYLLKLLRKGKVRWLHMAPPCGTLTQARRTDEYGSTPVLRTEADPSGVSRNTLVEQAEKDYPQLDAKGINAIVDGQVERIKEANEIVRRTTKLAKLQVRLGHWFSIENPERSHIWQLSNIKALRKALGVKLLVGDQCTLGAPFQKGTGWLTNADWMDVVTGRCPGPPEHHHPALKGFVEGPQGKRV